MRDRTNPSRTSEEEGEAGLVKTSPVGVVGIEPTKRSAHEFYRLTPYPIGYTPLIASPLSLMVLNASVLIVRHSK